MVQTGGKSMSKKRVFVKLKNKKMKHKRVVLNKNSQTNVKMNKRKRRG